MNGNSGKQINKKLNPGFAPLASSTFCGSRLNLDLDSSRFPGVDSSFRIHKEKLDYAFNDYIQALAKKRIISASIRNFETLLKQQINYQLHEIVKMKEECEQKKAHLVNSVRANELVNVLNDLEEKLEEFEKSTESLNMNKLMSLSNILEISARKCLLVGVKSLKNKEEWSLLLKLMNELCIVLKNFFESHKSINEFELINEISGKLQETIELQRNIQEQISSSSSLSKTGSVKYMEKIKDLCDVLGSASI